MIKSNIIFIDVPKTAINESVSGPVSHTENYSTNILENYEQK
jgi:hypothetical protein